MIRRRGFTLLELMVALTVTGIVVLLVYGAAAAAMDTERRLRERGTQGRVERAWQLVLEEALRNLRSAQDYRRPTFTIQSAPRRSGGSLQRLWFITAGAVPPLTPDADWEVVVEPVEGGRVAMTATPIGVDVPARRVLAPPAITGLDIQVLNPSGSGAWQQDWQLGFLPGAITLTYWSGGQPLGDPAHLRVPLGVVR